MFFSFVYLASGTVARNKPLNRSACRPKWKSDVPITETQLRRKREEYWDTGKIFQEVFISFCNHEITVVYIPSMIKSYI
jgi:hypothetical protein